jgi:DNA-binding transcriptional regulator YhcF (GntR family)
MLRTCAQKGDKVVVQLAVCFNAPPKENGWWFGFCYQLKNLASQLVMYTKSYMVDNKPRTPAIVIDEIRAAILDGVYQPGDRLLEADLAKKFKVGRSPVREALQALESDGTLFAELCSGTLVRPLSPAEASEITEIRLALIALAVKPAHGHLAPADFDLAYDRSASKPSIRESRRTIPCPATEKCSRSDAG